MGKNQDDENRKSEVNLDEKFSHILEGLSTRKDRVHTGLDHAPGGSLSQGVPFPAAAL
jgi:hypothetical protein